MLCPYKAVNSGFKPLKFSPNALPLQISDALYQFRLDCLKAIAAIDKSNKSNGALRRNMK
ncbi:MULTISPECIES: hypothetical protein [Planktothricoides]|uniref:Uncharacterized protein n=2 Tax=Planktothricoides raciborskii TaxID=132608 RepID=A0AAU8JI93_9CYAN|nr:MULTISPECIES: hypothetical protein [Planktothricoides]MBD2543744.1 hypothetical protein [Planktothricoides raciborskii FACHB-1370]MBD2582361.1 hypothetical protein [Planktothricoides raciborskii FACHB-1261]